MLLTLLAVVTVAVVRQRSLFVLTIIYSFLMASVLIVLDAVDVAMTEASVGAGISTVFVPEINAPPPESGKREAEGD